MKNRAEGFAAIREVLSRRLGRTVVRCLLSAAAYWPAWLGASVDTQPAAGHGAIEEQPSVAAKQDFEPEMVRIPAGTFKMGCLSNDGDCQEDEQPIRSVRVDEFWLAKTEVTFAQYDAYIEDIGGKKPRDRGWGRGDRPVIYVNWHEAKAYIQWLNEQTGKRYRLPSEAEWEYAARAGTRTKYSWGDNVGTNRANCGRCGSEWDSEKTAPVASFAANAWGLYDMHGNVWEWVEDRWHDNYDGAPRRGQPPWVDSGSSDRVVRGGSWYLLPNYLRSALRLDVRPVNRVSLIGFRLAEDR